MENRAIVFIHLGGTFVPAGLLVMRQEGNVLSTSFAYGRQYLQRPDAASIDPVSLPLDDGLFQTDGLFGGIRDSAPDGWGQHLLDIAAAEHGQQPQAFDYLTVLPLETRIGALAYGRDTTGPKRFSPPWAPEFIPGVQLDLKGMLEAADSIEKSQELDPAHARFLIRGSSLGGAQPKAPTEMDGVPWIAKFSREREAWSTCRIEHANMLLAAASGITVPATRILTLPTGRDIFLIKRFDRVGDRREHFVTAQTFVRAKEHQAGSYSSICAAMRRYVVASALEEDLKELYRRMVFNACCNNNDDHLKNHAFLYDHEARGWRLSPAYDVVPQPDMGPGQPRTLTLRIGEQGTRVSEENLLSGAAAFGLDHDQARAIIAMVKGTVRSNWESCAERAGVPRKDFTSLRESYRMALE
jgi:serine/threonine-protein kinase HipA